MSNNVLVIPDEFYTLQAVLLHGDKDIASSAAQTVELAGRYPSQMFTLEFASILYCALTTSLLQKFDTDDNDLSEVCCPMEWYGLLACAVHAYNNIDPEFIKFCEDGITNNEPRSVEYFLANSAIKMIAE